MLIIPAIDLQNGAAVRLLRGAFDAATQYGDPLDVLRSFERAGATWVHIVDLDGAKAGAPAQHQLIAELTKATALAIQAGGGVRTRAHVETLLAAGVTRVVVGSVAVRQPEEVGTWIAEFGAERLCVALDVQRDETRWIVRTDGWASSSGRVLQDVLSDFPPGGLRHVLVTDISRDGALSGANDELLFALVTKRPDLSFQASGGVAALEDIREQRAAGAKAIIIGRALYERRFTLEDALAV